MAQKKDEVIIHSSAAEYLTYAAVGFKINNDRAVRFRKWSGQIVKGYVLGYTKLIVSSLYIAQVKERCGTIGRVNYNLSKSENSRQLK